MMRIVATVIACSIYSAAAGAWTTLDDWATVIATQMAGRQSLPVPSGYGSALSLDEAYRVQRMVADELARVNPIVGFRASLTRPRAQVAFGVRQPVSGVIFSDQVLHGEVRLNLKLFNALTVVPAMGFVLQGAPVATLTDPRQVAPLIAQVVPVVDFADLRYDSAARLGGADFVATNNGAARVLVGEPLDPDIAAAVDSIVTEMAIDDVVIDRGRAVNVMGGQILALQWLINQLLSRGYSIPAGSLLVTGGLSDPVPARPGIHVVRFGDGVALRFEIAP
jgi:2-keto-4-pentenoate hydratase